MNKLILIFIGLIFLFPLISGFGITPAQKVLGYEPGSENTVSFNVVNSEKKNVKLSIIPQGELNQSVVLSTDSIVFTPDIAEVTISYTFKTPDGLKPGRHGADILIVEVPADSDSGNTYIGAVVGIVTKVVVDVPYPGKYIESTFNINKEQNGELSFVLPLVSKGNLDISKVYSKIDIFTPTGEKVTTLSTNEVSIPSLERRELIVRISPSSLAPGKYTAMAKVFYDGSTLEFEKEFFIGEGGLGIKNIMVDSEDFHLGGVAKFEFLVENKLNLAIDEIYVLMKVFDNDGQVLSEFKSATYDIGSYESKELTAFWDTENIKEGTYEAKAFIYSNQEPIEAQLTLKVTQDEIIVSGTGYVISSSSGKGSLVTILGIVIGVLVLLNLIWFLVLRKKLKHKN